MISTRIAARMPRTVIVLAAAFATAATSPAIAAPDPSGKAAKAQDEAPKAPKEKRYCVVEPKVTGSHLSRKTCKTRDRWIAENGFDPLEAKRAN